MTSPLAYSDELLIAHAQLMELVVLSSMGIGTTSRGPRGARVLEGVFKLYSSCPALPAAGAKVLTLFTANNSSLHCKDA